MEIIRGLHNIRPAHRGCVATIGNFDGVHHGHQLLLAHLNAKRDELPLAAVERTAGEAGDRWLGRAVGDEGDETGGQVERAVHVRRPGDRSSQISLAGRAGEYMHRVPRRLRKQSRQHGQDE